MHTICPAYEGSVKTSWYPDIDVLKTISPHASATAPHARPRNALPSSSTSSAGLFSLSVISFDSSLCAQELLRLVEPALVRAVLVGGRGAHGLDAALHPMLGRAQVARAGRRAPHQVERL